MSFEMVVSLVAFLALVVSWIKLPISARVKVEESASDIEIA